MVQYKIVKIMRKIYIKKDKTIGFIRNKAIKKLY